MLPFVYNLFKRTNILNNKRTSSPSRGTLYYQESKGKLIRIMPGFFVPESAELSDINMMQWIYAKQPDAVMNLISALSFHGLTTQIPAYLSLALPRGRVIPKNLATPIKVWYTKKDWILCGVQQGSGDYGPYLVTSPERTLIDCFRYRNKIGLEVFLEALQLGIKKHSYDFNKLAELSDIFKSTSLIKPYIKTAVR